MAEIVTGNGEAVAKAIAVLQRYEGKRSKTDVSMNSLDQVMIYLNAAKPEQQPTVKPDDVDALGALGFVQLEDDGYTVFVLR